MRVFLLRLLIGWWAVPLMWIFYFPIFFLLTGSREKSINFVSDLSRVCWYGSN
jgi:hypothetical protein